MDSRTERVEPVVYVILVCISNGNAAFQGRQLQQYQQTSIRNICLQFFNGPKLDGVAIDASTLHLHSFVHFFLI